MCVPRRRCGDLGPLILTVFATYGELYVFTLSHIFCQGLFFFFRLYFIFCHAGRRLLSYFVMEHFASGVKAKKKSCTRHRARHQNCQTRLSLLLLSSCKQVIFTHFKLRVLLGNSHAAKRGCFVDGPPSTEDVDERGNLRPSFEHDHNYRSPFPTTSLFWGNKTFPRPCQDMCVLCAKPEWEQTR